MARLWRLHNGEGGHFWMQKLSYDSQLRGGSKLGLQFFNREKINVSLVYAASRQEAHHLPASNKPSAKKCKPNFTGEMNHPRKNNRSQIELIERVNADFEKVRAFRPTSPIWVNDGLQGDEGHPR